MFPFREVSSYTHRVSANNRCLFKSAGMDTVAHNNLKIDQVGLLSAIVSTNLVTKRESLMLFITEIGGHVGKNKTPTK